MTLNVIGDRYGKLVVLERQGRHVVCKCDCGAETKTWLTNVRRGKTKSCGCLNSELSAARKLKHGKKGTKEYTAWQNMKKRCYDPNAKGYENYGGRGITVCDKWLSSFENFYSDMGDSNGLTLERADNDKGYSPSNCIWATRSTQMKNRRKFNRNRKLI